MSTDLDKLFHDPERARRPIRMLVYGPPKSGKSHFVWTATEAGPLYWVDTENGSDFYPPESGFKVRKEKDPQVILDAISAAHTVAAEGGPQPTVAVDSFTSIWLQQQDVAQKASGGRRASFRSWATAKAPLKKLYEMMHWAECHIIFTARGKTRYQVDEKGAPTEMGMAPDVERYLPFAVDFIVQVGVKELAPGQPAAPEDYWARVDGTRTFGNKDTIGHIPIGTEFKNPRFADFLVARLEGIAPSKIGDTIEEQVLLAKAPQTWGRMKKLLVDEEWTEERITEVVKEEFGEFDRDMIPRYFLYIKGLKASQ